MAVAAGLLIFGAVISSQVFGCEPYIFWVNCRPAGIAASLPPWREFRRPTARFANQQLSEDTSTLVGAMSA
jgi:hypothetical protein